MPPAPEKLDPAVAKIYELMEESVLVPFLNSVYPQSAHATVQSCPYDTSDDATANRTYDDRNSRYTRRSRYTRSSPPPQTAVEPHANSYTVGSHYRQSAPPLSASASPQTSRFSVKLTATTSSPAAIADLSGTGSDASGGPGPGMTDDSGSTSSPTNESPMTPPPASPHGSNEAQSPKRDSGMWKKLGRLSGMKVGRKKSHGGFKTEEDSHSSASVSTTQRSV